MLLLLLAFGLCSLRKGVFVQFTADVLVMDISLCQAFALKLFFFFFFGIFFFFGNFFFFFFFLGGKDIHYTSATITTSKKCDVHCKTNKAEANNTS